METRGHILTSFDEALINLKETTISMGSSTIRNLQTSFDGLMQRDKQLCNQAIADDDDTDQLEIEIDRLGMNIITKFRPMATDLRMVISSMKTAANLERISDQSVNIGKRARKMIKNPEIQERSNLEGLYQVSAAMLSDALTAYSDGDAERAVGIISRYNELKKVHKTTSRFFSKKLEGENEHYRDYLDLVFICRWLERIGDLSINIAEDIIFEETSTDVRHGGEIPPELTE
ncbi:MAG: phosphate signaling complex protein PhoU [Akkermansiaceae bacterium]